MSVVRVAVAQAAPALLDRAATLAIVARWVAEAERAGARLLAFPETFLPGYPVWLDLAPGAALWDHAGAKAVFARLFDQAIEVPSPHTEALAALAHNHGLTLVIGVHERVGRTLVNALLVFGPDGTLLNHHRKLVPTYSERMVWGPGDGAGLRAVETTAGRVGGLICWEHWMPLARQAMHDQREDFHVALWPAVREMHQVASRHYAFEGRCFVLAAGAVQRAAELPLELPIDGDPARLVLDGGSAIFAPDGAVFAGPLVGEEGLVVADCDLDLIARESMTIDVSGHYARPDIFRLSVDRKR